MADKKGFNNIDMTETERLAHLTQHLSHVLRFAGNPASKRPNPSVKRALEIAGNNPGIVTAELQGILKVADEQAQLKALYEKLVSDWREGE